MLARVADSLYWMGRYLERAERSARLLEVNLDLALYRVPGQSPLSWRYVPEALRIPDEACDTSDVDAVTRYVVNGDGNSDSILGSIAAARENARQVRDIISTDMWEQLNRLHLRVQQVRASSAWEAAQQPFLRSVQESVQLFRGVTGSSFSHGEGFYFLRVGTFLERSVCLTHVLHPHFQSLDDVASALRFAGDDVAWAGLLRGCAALEGYTRTYSADPRPRTIAEFLLLNAEFPHSLRYSVDAMSSALESIERATGAGSRRGGAIRREVGRLASQLQYTHVDEFLADDPGRYLLDVRRRCSRIHDLVYDVFISYQVQQAVVVS
jgi:uncharacterized alpha-E superfamily protein